MDEFTFTEALNNTSPLLALVMAVAALALVVFALRQRKRFIQLQRTHQRLLSDAEISHEILATAPDGLFLWVVANNSEACSRRLAVLLGLRDGVHSSYRAVIECFTGDDATVLMGATHKLRSQGTPFECVVTTKDGSRRLLVVGVRAGTGGILGTEMGDVPSLNPEPHGDGSLADVLWMRDVSDLAPPAEGASISARDIIEEMPLPAWLRGGRLGVQAINNAARILGVTETADNLAKRACEVGQTLSERHLLTLIDGSPHVLDITETPLPGGGTLGLAQDMTHAEQVESTFTRHIQAQNQVLETLATAIIIYSADQKVSFFNSAFARLWDLSPAWLEDEPGFGDVLERLREQRRLPEVANFKTFKAEQTALFGHLESPVDNLLHLPDGATLRCVTSPHPLGGLVFAFEDVTDHLDLERNYKTLSAVQRETLDNLYEGVVVFGVDGQVKLMNPAFERIWSLPPQTDGTALRMSGFIKHITTLIQRDDGDGEFDTIHLAAKLMSRDSDRGRVRRTDGGVLEYAKVPLPDGAVLLSYLDVTDSARVENALLERAHAMAEANVLKSDFMAGVSHEIRTPLNAIVGFASILTESYFGDLNSRQAQYSRGILESAEELIGIIDNMLDLASVEAGLMTLELDTIDVNQLLVTAMNLIRERARRKEVEIEFDSPVDIGWVVADEKRLKQVLFTLLSSAVANTPPAGHVMLTARREDANVVFRVTDGGPGLDDDQVPPGLTLITRFIELHNGEVELSKKPGRGTTVACHLPVESSHDSLRQPDLFSGFVGRSD